MTARSLARRIVEPAHGIAAGLVIAAAVVTLTPVPGPAVEHVPTTGSVYVRPPCQPTDVEHMTDAGIARLIAAGWTSDPTDGREALYAPHCR